MRREIIGALIGLLFASSCVRESASFAAPDLLPAPDLDPAVHDLARLPAPDLGTAPASDLAGTDLSKSQIPADMATSQPRDLATVQDDLTPTCGHSGQPCCSNNGCETASPGLVCYQSICSPCGGNGESCCGGDPGTHINGWCAGGSNHCAGQFSANAGTCT